MEDGAKINYRFFRSSKPSDDSFAVIPIHGWRLSGRIFNLAIPRLIRDFNVLVPELRGNPGGSTVGMSSPDSYLGDVVADIFTVSRSLGIEHAVIVGHSLGGLVALQTEAQCPGFADAAVLVSSPYTNPLETWEFGNGPRVNLLVRALMALAGTPLSDHFKDVVLARLDSVQILARKILDGRVMNANLISAEIFGDIYRSACCVA